MSKWGWQLIAINCNKLFRVGNRDIMPLQHYLFPTGTLKWQRTIYKCDYKLKEVFFFEILANSDEDYGCKICRAAIVCPPVPRIKSANYDEADPILQNLFLLFGLVCCPFYRFVHFWSPDNLLQLIDNKLKFIYCIYCWD